MYTNESKLSYLRNVAKSNGLTFKAVNVRHNNNQAYALFNRSTKERVSSDDTLKSWFAKELNESIISDYKAN